MAATKFGCPRCGGQKFFTTKEGRLLIEVCDDQGRPLEDEQIANTGIALSGQRVCADLRCGTLYIREHWEANAKQNPHLPTLRRILEDLACSSGVISYRDLSFMYKRLTGFWIDHRLRWAEALGALCDEDSSKGQYMIAALVIEENSGKPGPGFPWSRLGTTPDAPSAWSIWKKYVRQTHRHYFNARHRPWNAKARPHHAA